MYKIGQFSNLCQVSTRMLRHYEKLGMLKPEAVDRQTGYRSYTKRQLEQVHRIVALKELGMSLKEIGQLLKQNLTPDELNRILIQKQTELHEEIHQKQRILQRVGARLAILEQEGDVFSNEIIVKSSPSVTLASQSIVVAHMSMMEEACAKAYRELYEEVQRLGLQIVGPEMTLYVNNAFTEENIRMEATVQVEPGGAIHSDHIRVYELQGEVSVAALLYEGGYNGLETAVLQLLHWIGMQSYCIAGPVREVHLSGAASSPDGQLAKSALIELQAPIQLSDLIEGEILPPQSKQKHRP